MDHCGVNTWRQLLWHRLVLWPLGSLSGDLFPGTHHDTHIFLKRGGLLGCVVFGLAACGLVRGAVLRLLLFLCAVFVHLSRLGSQQRQRRANAEQFLLVSDGDQRSFDLFVLVKDVRVLWVNGTHRNQVNLKSG